MEKGQKDFECAIGCHREWLQKGCVRQCIHCKFTQIANISAKGISWEDMGVQDYDLKDLEDYEKKMTPYIYTEPSISTYKTFSTLSYNPINTNISPFISGVTS